MIQTLKKILSNKTYLIIGFFSGIATRDMNGDPIFTWKNTGKRFKIGLNETFNSLPTDTSIDDFENNVRHFIFQTICLDLTYISNYLKKNLIFYSLFICKLINNITGPNL